MCGIVGYVGKNEHKSTLLDGLKELEYRGYDSAGFAVLENGNFANFKATGKLENLRQKSENFATSNFAISIGHTRWATHGKPTEANAHPHLGERTYVVHNGIIENYQDIKRELKKDGVTFLSQTDTEVIVHLFEQFQDELDNNFEAFKKVIQTINGAYAILLITKSDPHTIYFAKHGSPLIIGQKEDEWHFGSSDAALIGKCDSVHYFEDGEFGYVSSENGVTLYGSDAQLTSLTMVKLATDKLYAQKEGYSYFMEKEIYEQSSVIVDTLMGRIDEQHVILEELDNTPILDDINEIKLCACGTSYHAALSASYLIERQCKIRVSVEIGSEFRYKDPLLLPDTLFIAISQSGETADTLESLKMAKEAGLKTLAICNVDNSSIVRLADHTLLTRAGIEKGVASTKAFATQVIVLWLFSLYLANKRQTLSQDILSQDIHALRELPNVLSVSSNLHEKLHRLSKRYLHGHGFFFIGRDIFYPLALEGALKLKEISYLHAEGYPSGEMKHGPIALADPELFTIALLPEHTLYDKTKSNVEELSARDSTICAISPLPFELSDDFIKTKARTHPMHEFFEMMVVVQILAMEISIRLGNDVDMPRNLAKSVTVE